MIEIPEMDMFGINHDFQVGFECGAIWAIMLHTSDDVKDGATFTVHISNAEMLLELADTIGYRLQSKEEDDHWMVVVFTKMDIQD